MSDYVFRFAKRLSNVKPSPTLGLKKLAQDLKAAGQDIIDLSTGEPDFDTPEPIKDAAKKAIDDGKTKYTAVDGTAPLKRAIVSKFEKENKLLFEPSQISVGAGGKQVLYNAFMATLDEGDEVLIPTPYWVSYPDMVNLASGTPVFVETKEEADFKLNPQDLDKAITPHSRWLILNSPSNPSGAAYTAKELRAIADVLTKHPHVMVLVDDMYEHIVYDGFEFTTLLQIAPELADRTLTVNGVSKSYNMTGWRIGYAAGPVPLIKKLCEIQGHSTSNPSSISQEAALEALLGSQAFMKDQLKVFQDRRDLVVDALNEIPGISCRKPEGAFYVYPGCGGLIGKKDQEGKSLADDNDVASYFLKDCGVAVVPGSAFGLSPHFRISYATATEDLKEACRRMKKSVLKLSL